MLRKSALQQLDLVSLMNMCVLMEAGVRVKARDQLAWKATGVVLLVSLYTYLLRLLRQLV